MLGLNDISSEIARQGLETLTVVLTQNCPVGCAHCAPACGPIGKDEASSTVNLDALDVWMGEPEANPFRYLIVTGGEPFSRRKALARLCRIARRRGLLVAVVTSGYWAVSERKAKSLLAGLREQGLRSITLSVDRAHQDKIPAERVRIAIQAAKKLGLGVAISHRFLGVQNAACEEAWLRETLSDCLSHVDGIASGPTQPLGRALDRPMEAELDASGVAKTGPRLCPAWGVTVMPGNEVSLCCGALAQSPKALILGRLATRKAASDFRSARAQVLGLILQIEGLTTLLDEVMAVGVWKSDRVYHPNDFCGLCHDLLDDEGAIQAILAKFGTPENIRKIAIARLRTYGDAWTLTHLSDLKGPPRRADLHEQEPLICV